MENDMMVYLRLLVLAIEVFLVACLALRIRRFVARQMASNARSDRGSARF